MGETIFFFKMVLVNLMAEIIETWYTALGTRLLSSSFDDPRLTFAPKGQMITYAFVWENA